MTDPMPTATSCAWCLNTPPRHDRCTGDDTNPPGEPRTNWYAPATGHPCACSCRIQAGLW